MATPQDNLPVSSEDAQHDDDEKHVAKKQKTSRHIVDSLHLSVLIASYSNHFNEYSSKHCNTTQLVPSKVWKKVYDEYTTAYPNSPFTQETLKMRLRGELSALNTGNSNVGDGKACLQSDEVLAELKMTNGHAKRNVLIERSNIINGEPGVTIPQKSTYQKQDPASKQKPTKVEMLQQQVESLNVLADAFRKQQEDGKQYNEAKLTKVKLENLKTLKAMGVLTEDEFKQKALAF
ncbi:hypothetical protein LEN26_017712 [Aphanomyces euteiches]|nr:hypothetical protein LEN26_017712 [Aphanomyces euteiches]